MCPKMNVQFLSILLISTIFTIPIFATPTPNTYPSRFLKHKTTQNENNSSTSPPQYYFEVTQPLPTSPLTPSCTLPLFNHNFSNTYGQPPITIPYSPPKNCAWTHATLQFTSACKGNQYDRISAVWLGGVELLRTSTAEPTDDGIFWKVEKDVTKYYSLLVQENITLAVMLENIVDDVFTGVYQVNVSFIYFSVHQRRSSSRKVKKTGRKFLENGKGFSDDNGVVLENGLSDSSSSSSDLYVQPADLIIPVSGREEEGFWFRIESELDKKLKRISIPRNTYKTVLELYVSFHGNDEFWYKNPPNSYIISNNLITQRGNGAYREVFVTVDGKLVGSVVPFPVIFTGGINPLFWEPVVGIGAFNLPTYDIDLTPFLSFLLDGEMHSIGLGVADGISFWLVDANLHIWLDPFSEEVQAGYFENEVPSFEIERSAEFDGLNGEFEVEIERTMEFSGWVNSSFGNFTTYVKHELEFESNIEIKKDGNKETIEQEVTDKIEVKLTSSSGSTISEYKVEKEYALEIETTTTKGANGTYTMTTSLDNSYEEETNSSELKNRQKASGWMLVEGNEVLDGQSNMNQEYSYKGNSICYSREVSTANGTLLTDNNNLLCLSSY
ncbi:hypothetical protein LIER_27435 [Lithospermum erythrorhizon]|uniref:Peptide N-acetyl-beta-D-glucosaminyl asparaginase amidase A N-terminal domain-containing protein n=1 Tax=Lithospermum erythrorhizon TaxID=34254 RepID=A0AAV3RCB3_LITER